MLKFEVRGSLYRNNLHLGHCLRIYPPYTRHSRNTVILGKVIVCKNTLRRLHDIVCYMSP